MDSWNEGYVTDINYTNGYYTEVNPLSLSLPFLNKNLVEKKISNVCELGFGQGISIAMHAASQAGVQYWGTDFNPSQTAFAQSLVEASGASCFLFDQSFEEFCRRSDLPQFDFIALHGIWSWVSPENRQFIIDFLRTKLAVGGVVYISYNAFPGWSAPSPMRQIFSQYAESIAPPSQSAVEKVAGAISFFETMTKLDPAYVHVNPNLVNTFDYVKGQDPSYLAHEYFNRHWTPMYFATMAEALVPTKLEFACSATLLEHVEVISLNAEQSVFVNAIADPVFRESVRDMFVNQKFRRDYWIKGKQKISNAQRADQILEKEFVLVLPRKTIELFVSGPKSKVALNESIYNPILDLMADHKVRSVREIQDTLAPKLKLSMDQIIQVLMILVSKGSFSAAQPKDKIDAAISTSHKLNRHLMSLALKGNPIQYLASPVTGAAIGATNVDQMFLNSIVQGRSTKEQLVEDAWRSFLETGIRINQGNSPQMNEAENRLGLQKHADLFIEQKLPIYRALRVI